MPSGSPRVRVAMPMVNLVPGGMGGTETYARELTEHLAAHEGVSVHAFVPRSAAEAPFAVDTSVLRSIAGAPGTGARLASIARAAFGRGVSHQVFDQADVVHFPFTVPVPRPVGRPHVITLHDVQHLDMPQFFPRAERAYRRWAYDKAALRADAVITVSEFCRQRVVEVLGVPSHRVHVAHLAVADGFTPGRRERQEFVLYPSRRWPHKNHQRLLAAMELVRRERPTLRLVLTGGGEPLPGAPSWVEQRGLVPREELSELYRTAGCMAFPSLYEGFGLPPLEAMASGCPVAVSTAGSLPEICGDAGVSFDPLSVPDMAAAILVALDGGERRTELGRERAATFTWRRCAEQHVAVYRTLVER